MAQSKSKIDDSAEKAYAEASSGTAPTKVKPLAETLKADATAGGKPAAKKAPAPAPAPAAKAKAKKSLPTKAQSAKKPALKKITAAKKTPAAKSKPTVTQLKEKIMATQNTDYTAVMTDTMANAVKDMQDRTQAAYEKSTAAMTDMTDFAKGNVEAVVESGKIVAEGVQTLGKTYADEAKVVYETATADMKEMAAIKSPTELFQLQGKIMRRNFDFMVAATSKNTDVAMKLANEAMAPITGRVNVAAEKLSKVA
ncbi:phasin family protein [Aurantiacibacter aquimixticola]|uniref:Phasin family protein n=1 Tax=Aurantiacibacter aquimixticola TaxID=1958945 RepID=A0A419RTT3_9SPHN|nr:phasin family protein [Aurantiacibacter aquimixticola]RJY09195.1 phasin family protein [Aurantiacibacter aquimixticola]